MFLPISRNYYTTPIALIACLAVVITQCIMEPSAIVALLTNFGCAMLLSYGIWDMIDRNHFGHSQDNYAFSIGTVILTSAFNFTHLFMADAFSSWQILIVTTGLFIILHLAIGAWQREHSPEQTLLMGLIIGGISTFMPHFLYILILFPIIFYMMHSFSGSNLCALLLGCTLGIWIVYLMMLLIMGDAIADAMILNYRDLILIKWNDISFYNSWALLFGGCIAVLCIIHGLANLFAGSADSVRKYSSVILLSIIMLLMQIPLALDSQYSCVILCILALLLAINYALQETHTQTSIGESWILFVEILLLVLNVLPFFFENIIALF